MLFHLESSVFGVMKGEICHNTLQNDTYFPGRQAINMAENYDTDIDLLIELGINAYRVIPFHGHVFFQKVMKINRILVV